MPKISSTSSCRIKWAAAWFREPYREAGSGARVCTPSVPAPPAGVTRPRQKLRASWLAVVPTAVDDPGPQRVARRGCWWYRGRLMMDAVQAGAHYLPAYATAYTTGTRVAGELAVAC